MVYSPSLDRNTGPEHDCKRLFLRELVMKEFKIRFGEGTAFDLDYGKLLILALCVYIAVQVS